MDAEQSTLDWTIDQKKYVAHRQEIVAIWQPINNHVANRINTLTKLIWRRDCLTDFGRDDNSEILNTQAANLEHMNRPSLEQGSLSERMDAEIRQFNREIRAIEHEIDQLQRKFKSKQPPKTH